METQKLKKSTKFKSMNKKLFKNFLALFLMLAALTATAQSVEVSGTVSDETGPLPGVNIVEKGTTNGTTTDFDGNYSISVADGATLVFSYISFKTQEILVNGQNSIKKKILLN